MRKARASATMTAPCIGGLEYIGRTIRLSWESTRDASSLSEHTTETVPTRSPVVVVRARVGGEGYDRLTPFATTTSRHVSPYSPKFLAKDWARTSECPASAKRRIEAESASASPEAKPWCDGGVGVARSRRGGAAVGVVSTTSLAATWYAQSMSTWCPAARMASETFCH